MILPRLASGAIIFAALSVPLTLVSPVRAADAPTTAAAMDPALKTAVEDFWHYGKIARYELATAAGQKILDSGAEPRAILEAFEAVSTQRHDNLNQWMIRW